ncbi:hypothetical protein B5F07_02530 [Lachnoclostridium sp. An169]|nr:hypothetical protein B5F07_02530 [Lachnoclostridium sp. An169]
MHIAVSLWGGVKNHPLKCKLWYKAHFGQRNGETVGKSVLILTCVSGFIDKFEKENVRILRELGYEVHYASNMKEQHYLFDPKEYRELGVIPHDICVERSPFMVRANSKALRQIIEIVEQNNIDIIHCHAPVGGVLGRLAGRYFRHKNRDLRVIYTAHGFHFYKGAPLINNTVYKLAEKILAHYTDVLITINREDYESAKKLHLRKGGRVYQLPSIGLDMERFRPLSDEEKKRQRKELHVEDKFFLVSVGELNENKNHIVVLQALKKMRDSGEDISGIVYGICGDGFFHDRMREWIDEMGLQDNVRMFGYCMDVRPIEGCADASVFPSLREGLGMAALEALAMGVPLIASDNRGTREYMEHQKNGYVCNSSSPESFVEGIRFVQGLEPEARRKMQKYCRESVMKFDKKYANEIMRHVYQEEMRNE